MRLRDLWRFWETVRHLRPIQIVGRIRYRLARPVPRSDVAVAPRGLRGAWVEPIYAPVTLIAPTRLRLLNQEHDIDAVGWDDPGVPLLWRYNLHYFADLSAEGRDRRKWQLSLMRRWVAENPAGRGTGWAPYPTSLRIVNWIKFALAGGDLDADLQRSLATQLDWLTKRLEVHLLGNHLFSNAKALIYGGLFFEGAEAKRWLKLGLGIISTELPEQVLADGGHFERSPMYHALAVEDLLDLLNVTCAFAGPAMLEKELRTTIPRMLGWLEVMTHPDGGVAFFNDAAFEIAPSLDELKAYAMRFGIFLAPAPKKQVVAVEASGYVRVAMGDYVALLDVAPVGPDYLPGHAHADTLSFELSHAGRRLLVNSGTSEYGTSAERLRQRGTAAHNTVLINQQSSSDVWSGFRVGRRARVSGLEIKEKPEKVEVTCRHDGYLQPFGIVHERRWTFTPEAIVVRDSLSKPAEQAEVRLHFHPDIVVRQVGSILQAFSDGTECEIDFEGRQTAVLDGSWHPRFGESIPAKLAVSDLPGTTAKTTFNWRRS